MKLNTPKTVTLVHRVDLPKHLNYLSASGTGAFLTAKVKPAGHLNPEYVTAHDAIDIQRKVFARDLMGSGLEGEARAKRAVEDQRTIGTMLLEALYDHCIESWDTNIESDKKVIEPTRENFFALSEQRIPEIAEWFQGLQECAGKIASFILAEDEEAEKN